jgi:preprotein translocase subunit SecD
MLSADQGEKAWGVTRISVGKDARGMPTVEIELDDAGAKRMAALSESHLHDQLAVLVNDRVIAIPRLMSKLGNKMQITGNFSDEEVKALVTSLGGEIVSAHRATE